MFGNDSKHRRVSTTKHPASIKILDVVALNGGKMLSAWFEQAYRLISVIYKEILETKILSRIKKIIKKFRVRLSTEWRIGTIGKGCARLAGH